MKKLLLGILLGLLVEIGNAQNLACSQALMQINNDSLLKKLQELVGKSPVIIDNTSQYISSRYAFHPNNILAAKYLENTCTSYGYNIRKMEYSGTGTNIIAEKKGTIYPNKSIILCAHYDCVGGNITSFQGADDNASGVAALLEAARVLKNIDFPYSIQLAFWDEEELGLLGSKSYPSTGGNLPEIICVINLDMIAWDGDNDSLA
ncbi:MAG: M28 family peptidase, partial [Bacteroidia bacterium]|nr:M28 family peptidase [Bacteroidia bacterium]